MIHRRMSIAIGSAALLAFIAPACSSDSKTSSTTAAGTPAVSSATGDTTAAGGSTAAAGSGLTISGSQFSAASVTAGTEFTITNEDSVGHTVTDDAGSFDVSVPAGGTATLTIPTAGTYKIHCKIHSFMHGTITVA
jgi:plastocyanin